MQISKKGFLILIIKENIVRMEPEEPSEIIIVLICGNISRFNSNNKIFPGCVMDAEENVKNMTRCLPLEESDFTSLLYVIIDLLVESVVIEIRNLRTRV